MKCPMCGHVLSKRSFFTHMKQHSQALNEQCIVTREKLKAYMLTLQMAAGLVQLQPSTFLSLNPTTR